MVQNKLLAMSVLNLLNKDDVLVYHDMLSILTPDINFRIPPSFTLSYEYFHIVITVAITAHTNTRTHTVVHTQLHTCTLFS